MLIKQERSHLIYQWYNGNSCHYRDWAGARMITRRQNVSFFKTSTISSINKKVLKGSSKAEKTWRKCFRAYKWLIISWQKSKKIMMTLRNTICFSWSKKNDELMMVKLRSNIFNWIFLCQISFNSDYKKDEPIILIYIFWSTLYLFKLEKNYATYAILCSKIILNDPKTLFYSLILDEIK